MKGGAERWRQKPGVWFCDRGKGIKESKPTDQNRSIDAFSKLKFFRGTPRGTNRPVEDRGNDMTGLSSTSKQLTGPPPKLIFSAGLLKPLTGSRAPDVRGYFFPKKLTEPCGRIMDQPTRFVDIQKAES